jgi:hypothetical protein
MILGFAHLAVNVSDLLGAEALWCKEGYTRSALYLAAPNHPSKKQYTSTYHPSHDLMLLTGAHLWPLELTCHGATYSVNKQLKWGREFILITVPDPAPLQRLLVDGLGFRMTEDGSLILNSCLPGWTCRLRLQMGETAPVSLDRTGPTCLAFYCNQIEEDTQRLLGLGAKDNIEPFDISLGARDMTIAMLRGPGGLLIELINPRKKI